MTPILPENKARYPKDWKEIRSKILRRAGEICEWPNCVAAHGHVGYWDGEEFVSCGFDHAFENGFKPVKIVLTIAHLNHTPEDCGDDNLRAWCQRHHNRYDAKHRAETRKRRSA